LINRSKDLQALLNGAKYITPCSEEKRQESGQIGIRKEFNAGAATEGRPYNTFDRT